MPGVLICLALAASCGFLVTALPSGLERRDSNGELPDDFDNHPWMPQSPGQKRSPCPALNTLANHGYLPRDGQGISREDLSTAFEAGFGVGQSVIETATANAFAVCEFNNGPGQCPTFGLNDLNTPDTFEHDHSLSRQDYNMLWAGNLPVNNHDFNRTIFGSGLNTLLGKSTIGVVDIDEFRLERESLAYQLDPANTFKPNYFTQLTEVGFIFSVMRNFNGSRGGANQQSPNTLSDQTVQVDWWEYWFSRQQFPTELGWRKPITNVERQYVEGIRSSVFSASATSSPTPAAPGVTSSLTTDPLFATKAKRQNDLPTEHSIVIPTLTSSILGIPTSIISKIRQELGPTPPPLLPYEIEYSAQDFSSYKSALSSYKTAFDSLAESLLGINQKRAEATPAPTTPAVLP